MLHVSYGAAIDTEHWKRQMEEIFGLKQADHISQKVIERVIRQTCSSFSDMLDARIAALATKKTQDAP